MSDQSLKQSSKKKNHIAENVAVDLRKTNLRGGVERKNLSEQELLDDDKYQQMVLAEYTALYTCFNTLWTKRASILGVGTTLVIALFGFCKRQSNHYELSEN